ncbi:hypothetical protein Tco_0590584 [Tanacetum coccineum]
MVKFLSRWQQKMLFYLTTLCLVQFLKETAPRVEPRAEGQFSNAQAVEEWKHSDFLCHNYVLNGLIDPLYNVYCKTTTRHRIMGVIGTQVHKTERCWYKEIRGTRFFGYKMVEFKERVSRVSRPACSASTRQSSRQSERNDVDELGCSLRIGRGQQACSKDTYTPESAKANLAKKSEYLAPKAGIVKQSSKGLAPTLTSLVTVLLIAQMPKAGDIHVRQILWLVGLILGQLVMLADKSMFHIFQSGYMTKVEYGPTSLQLLISRVKGDDFEDDTEKRAQVD